MPPFDVAALEDRFAQFVGDVDPATKKGIRRRSVLETATRLFAEQGYRGTSMEDVAAAVGVGKGTLYLYFPTKIDLFVACAALEKMQWLPRLVGILTSDASAADRLKGWIVAAIELPSKSPLFLRVLEDAEMAAIYAELPAELTEQNSDLMPQLMGPLLEELAGPEHRWSKVELADRVHVVASAGFLGPALRHPSARGGMSIERFAAIYADFIVDGLRPRSTP